jgi:hypothetical protein
MKRILVLAAFAIAAAAAFGQEIALPQPSVKSGVDLFSAIKNRAISRTFVKKDVSTQDLSTILWAGLGQRPVDAVTSASKANRTISFSGDNAYISAYVLTDKGAWKYIPDGHKLAAVGGKDVRAEVSTGVVPASAFMVLFTVDNALTPPFLKNNPGMFLQMANATAGFAAQNIALTASALKMSSIIKYTLSAQKAAGALKMGKDEVPLFSLQAGYTE